METQRDQSINIRSGNPNGRQHFQRLAARRLADS